MLQPHLRVRLIFHLSESLPPGGRGTAIAVVGARVYKSIALVLWRVICDRAAGSFRHFLAKMPPPSRREACVVRIEMHNLIKY